MKITLVVSLLSLVIGYLIGKSSTPTLNESDPKVSVQSSSRSSTNRQRTSTPPLNRSEEFSRLIHNLEAFPTDKVHTGRLHAWILQLQLDEIPEAISVLLDREEKHQKDLYGGDRFIETEMLLLLTRWYELNGENVLEWVRNQNHWDRREAHFIEAQIIADGYHRNPSRGLELSVDLLTRLDRQDQSLPADTLSLVFYQAGLHSQEPSEALTLLDQNERLRSPKFFPATGGPVAVLDSSSINQILKSFGKGLVDSGREMIAREILEQFGGTTRGAFEEVFAEEALQLDWPALKNKIDQGLVSVENIHCLSIVDEIGNHDSDQAISWYLDLYLGPYHPRTEKISSLIGGSNLFRIPGEEAPGDPFGRDYTLNFNEAQKWLESMEAEGEPVEQAWGTMIENALKEQRSDLVSAYRGKVSPKQWRHFEDTIINSAISTSRGGFHERDLVFDNPRSDGFSIGLVKEFGLEDRLHEKINVRNETTRQHLREILAEME